jgi:hypothetical protein
VGGAGRAGAAEHDVVRADVVAEALADVVEEALDLGVLERVEPAAAVADRVVVVVAARVGRLVAGDAVDVDPVHQLELGQHVECAVDACQADRLAAAELVVDLLGAEAAILLREQRQHLFARAAGAVPCAQELAMRVFRPRAHGRGHRIENENEFQ